MPGKTHRRRDRYSARGKKRQGTLARVAPPPAVEETHKPVTPAAPSPERKARRETTAGAGYHYIASELRRIGILAAVMLAILIVLSLFF